MTPLHYTLPREKKKKKKKKKKYVIAS